MDLEFTWYGEGGVHPAVALQGVLAHPAHRLHGQRDGVSPGRTGSGPRRTG